MVDPPSTRRGSTSSPTTAAGTSSGAVLESRRKPVSQHLAHPLPRLRRDLFMAELTQVMFALETVPVDALGEFPVPGTLPLHQTEILVRTSLQLFVYETTRLKPFVSLGGFYKKHSNNSKGGRRTKQAGYPSRSSIMSVVSCSSAPMTLGRMHFVPWGRIFLYGGGFFGGGGCVQGIRMPGLSGCQPFL